MELFFLYSLIFIFRLFDIQISDKKFFFLLFFLLLIFNSKFHFKMLILMGFKFWIAFATKKTQLFICIYGYLYNFLFCILIESLFQNGIFLKVYYFLFFYIIIIQNCFFRISFIFFFFSNRFCCHSFGKRNFFLSNLWSDLFLF